MKSSIEAKLPRSPPCTTIGNYMKNTREHIFDPLGAGREHDILSTAY
jgi:hypothetical protein